MAHAVDETKVMALTNRLQLVDFLKYLIRKAPSSFGEVLDKAYKHTDCEDIFYAWVTLTSGLPER